jgi:hypothetical protein
VTIGQVDPAPGSFSCSTNNDYLQSSVTSGKAYVVPGTGIITSWSHNAIAGAGQNFAMKVFRKVADPATYMVVGHDGPRPLTQSALNTFQASIPVRPGDILGANSGSVGGSLTGCRFAAPSPGDSYLIRSNSNLADGETDAFMAFPNSRINISARLEPDCDSDGLGDETQDTNLSSCAPAPGPAPTPPGQPPGTCKGIAATIVGTDGNDALTGTPGADAIAALGGNDKVLGLAGNDTICGGSGKDTLKGGAGNDFLGGQKGNDKLYGQKANDMLSGKAGNDTLKGGPGKDKLKGGAGRDKQIQ